MRRRDDYPSKNFQCSDHRRTRRAIMQLAMTLWCAVAFFGNAANSVTAYLCSKDGSGTAQEILWTSKYDGHESFLPGPGSVWIISDTYVINGEQHLFLYHRPTKIFVPPVRLKSTTENVSNFTGEYRVDLHPRFSRDGRIICIDATHEGLSRQMYTMNIGDILDHPPTY